MKSSKHTHLLKLCFQIKWTISLNVLQSSDNHSTYKVFQISDPKNKGSEKGKQDVARRPNKKSREL